MDLPQGQGDGAGGGTRLPDGGGVHAGGPHVLAVVRTLARIHANNGDTCRPAALEHQGIILQPDFIIADDLRRGDLVELLPTWRAMTLGIHAVYPSRKHLPIKTRRLVDFLVEAFAVPEWEVAR